MTTPDDIHRARDLESLFAECFEESHRTILVGGGLEPLYTPGQGGARSRIVYTRDYFASALHEVAHWCLAGPRRRTLVDFGYWYVPDGRDAAAQAEFERVEVEPQALEWILSDACRFRFHLSADNAEGGLGPSPAFAEAVARRHRRYREEGLPLRAARFRERLEARYGGGPDSRSCARPTWE